MRGLSGVQQGVRSGRALRHLCVHQPGSHGLLVLTRVLECPGTKLGDLGVDVSVAPVGAGEVEVAERLGGLTGQREGSAADDVPPTPL